MMKKGFFSLPMLALFVLVLSWSTGQDADAAPQLKKRVQFEDQGFLSVGGGYLFGDTTYRIDLADAATGQAVTSELKFPLQTFLLDFGAGYITRDNKGRDVFALQARYQFNVGTGEGKLEDSDWLNDAADIAQVGTAHPGKDIYSESTIDLVAKIADVRMTYTFWSGERFGIGPLIGYQHQNYSFVARDLRQTGYGPYQAGFTGTAAGDVLAYDVTYSLPYLGIHTDLTTGKSFRLLLDLGYSPWAKAEDSDDHVLRTKLSTARTSGDAYLAELIASFELEEEGNTLQFRGQYVRIDTTGKQTQRWYGNADAPNAVAGDFVPDISDKITSEQISALLVLSCRF